MKKGKIYRLAIKRGNKDYVPLEWNLSSLYNGEDLTSLEEIDTFTSKTSVPELFTDMMDKGVIDPDDKIQDISIIFFEKGNVREIPHGPIFDGVKEIIVPNTLKEFISSNINNKHLMNKIYNFLNKYQGEEAIDKVRLILHNLDLFVSKGEKYIKVALEAANDIEYEELRNIVLYIENTLKPELEEEQTQKKTYKNKEQRAA